MPITFVHLSDIHFGQEKGHLIIVHDDVKERLLEDAAREVKSLAGRADGIIVSGDIAYGGKTEEYKAAGAWLDKLAAAIGCSKTAVQVVPGNHDIDRKGISSGCKLMLEAVIDKGESKLDEFLNAEVDRESLYGRFSAYRPFAEGYNCPLDPEGGIASDRRYQLAPGRILRIIGLNSALICSDNDKEGRLLLGGRQRVLPITAGEELVVLCHHPLHWLQDNEDARRYVRARARVFVSGHEHSPSLKIEDIKDGCQLMTLAAGATVPPRAENGFTYTYNLLSFDWDPASDGLKVKIVPRAWSQEDKHFEADADRLGGQSPEVNLASPNFRNGDPVSVFVDVKGVVAPVSVEGQANASAITGAGMIDERISQLLLRFFRDLSPTQRIAVLVQLKALPETWRDPLTHMIERQVVDRLIQSGRVADLEEAVQQISNQNDTKPGEAT